MRRFTAMSRLPITTVLFATSLLGSACGVTQFQTARTVPPGAGQVSVGAGYLYNKLLSQRKHSVANFPVEAHTRWGLIPKLDLGVSVFDLAGGQFDLKYNFLPEGSPAALALSAGFAGAWDWSHAGFLKLPVTLHFSYDVPDIITPYLALGWQAIWVLGYEGADDPDAPGLDEPTGRPTYGDHMLTATAGLAIALDRDVRLLLEYDYSHQLIDDPADGHRFVDSHLFAVGVMINFSFRKRPETGPPTQSPPGSIIPSAADTAKPSVSSPRHASSPQQNSGSAAAAQPTHPARPGNHSSVSTDGPVSSQDPQNSRDATARPER